MYLLGSQAYPAITGLVLRNVPQYGRLLQINAILEMAH